MLRPALSWAWTNKLCRVDDADRARRIASSWVVLIIVAVTVAALLILIVVGAITSGETPELGRLRPAFIRPTIH
jgi:hypothetical protein